MIHDHLVLLVKVWIAIINGMVAVVFTCMTFYTLWMRDIPVAIVFAYVAVVFARITQRNAIQCKAYWEVRP